MRALLLLLVIVCMAHADANKGQSLGELVSLQQRILEIAKRNQTDPFKPNTSNLNEKVESELKSLGLERLSSEQLYRLGIACSMAAWPQEAGDQNWDLVFDDVAWKCVRILSTRPGQMPAFYLESMKHVFGRDSGPSLWFKDYIKDQAKLSEQGAAGQPPPAAPTK